MVLQIQEKIGAFIAFIPGISFISGLIKARIYYNRTKGSENIARLSETARTADQLAQAARKKLLSYLEVRYNNKLFDASIAEMIPVINVISAIYSIYLLKKISNVRELIQNPERAQDARRKIFEIYQLHPFRDEAKNEQMCIIIALLEESNLDMFVGFCYGMLSADREIALTTEQVMNAVHREDKRYTENNAQRAAARVRPEWRIDPLVQLQFD